MQESARKNVRRVVLGEDDLYRRFNLRLPKALHRKLAVLARQKAVSVNAEIVHRLSESVERDLPSDTDRSPGEEFDGRN